MNERKNSANIDLEWMKDFVFEGRDGAHRTRIDGDGDRGPSPVTLLLEAVGACAGIDVVEILRKGRKEPSALRVEVSGTRRPEPPRRFTDLSVVFRLRGVTDRRAAERAADLSFEKYCSVFHTLREDLDVEWRVVLEDVE